MREQRIGVPEPPLLAHVITPALDRPPLEGDWLISLWGSVDSERGEFSDETDRFKSKFSLRKLSLVYEGISGAERRGWFTCRW